MSFPRGNARVDQKLIKNIVIAKPRSGCGNPGYPELHDLIRILNKFSIKICLYLIAASALRASSQ
ncbi:hypothetical protein [Rickettsia endosymbiont of Orchestes rusci]|uniref:hypothetical protein n=1 Tax=Rickettsia endosymbiont of Orchestes rusci TaxID=3066250 RepID=UPI00313A814B